MSGRAYVYDGSVEGLFSVVFRSFAQRELPEDVVRREMVQLRLGQEACFVETDIDAAFRVARGLGRTCGRRALEAVMTASLSDAKEAGLVCARFCHHAMRAASLASKGIPCSACPEKRECCDPCEKIRRPKIVWELSDPMAGELLSLERSVLNERHRMLQFLRFEELEGGMWFARCNPKASVVPLLMGHFAERFNAQDFMVYDEVHGILGLFAAQRSDRNAASSKPGASTLIPSEGLLSGRGGKLGGRWWIVKTDGLALPEETGIEREMKRAWKAFYDSVSVEERFNPELRRSFVPLRLWRNITELREVL